MWACFAKLIIPPTKKRKLGPRIIDCVFIAYAQYNVAYKFLVIKFEVNGNDSNTIIESRQYEGFKEGNIYKGNYEVGSHFHDCILFQL